MIFFKDKKILITGATGFKGAWLSILLHNLGAKVVGLGLPPITSPSLYELANIKDKVNVHLTDIRNLQELEEVFAKEEPEIVFHLAAQALVIEAYDNPAYTYETNIMGTFNVLSCIKKYQSKIGIIITSDKCYENKNQYWGYREIDELGGFDVYSSSKACAEIITSSVRRSYFSDKDIASVRAGNAIGGGDWSQNRLFADIIRFLEKNEEIIIKNPHSTRPWQHVLEPLFGYLLLAKNLWQDNHKFATSFNFGPLMENVKNVETVVKEAIKFYGQGSYKVANQSNNYEEANRLSLDITKAYHMLGWQPVFNYSQAIQLTIDWYKRYKTSNPYDLCCEQISYYQNLLKSKKVSSVSV